MKTLLNVIKEDIREVSKVVPFCLKGFVKGIYVPFCLSTGTRQIRAEIANIEREDIDTLQPEPTLQVIGKIGGAITTFFVGLTYSAWHDLSHDNTGKYLALLAATNTIDYLINAYKRGKAKS